jgi:hypothetical protein
MFPSLLDDYCNVHKTIRIDGLSKDAVYFYKRFTKLFDKYNFHMTEHEGRQYLLTKTKEIINEYPNTAKEVLGHISNNSVSPYIDDTMLLYHIDELIHNIFCMSDDYDFNVLVGFTIYYHEKEVIDITNDFV